MVVIEPRMWYRVVNELYVCYILLLHNYELTCSTPVRLDNRSTHFLYCVGATKETASERQAQANKEGGTVTKEESVSE